MKNRLFNNVFTGETDKNGVPIHFETTKLKLPNGELAYLMFDYGRLQAYFGREGNLTCIAELDGVNNHGSYYLSDCEVV